MSQHQPLFPKEVWQMIISFFENQSDFIKFSNVCKNFSIVVSDQWKEFSKTKYNDIFKYLELVETKLCKDWKWLLFCILSNSCFNGIGNQKHTVDGLDFLYYGDFLNGKKHGFGFTIHKKHQHCSAVLTLGKWENDWLKRGHSTFLSGTETIKVDFVGTFRDCIGSFYADYIYRGEIENQEYSAGCGIYDYSVSNKNEKFMVFDLVFPNTDIGLCARFWSNGDYYIGKLPEKEDESIEPTNRYYRGIIFEKINTVDNLFNIYIGKAKNMKPFTTFYEFTATDGSQLINTKYHYKPLKHTQTIYFYHKDKIGFTISKSGSDNQLHLLFWKFSNNAIWVGYTRNELMHGKGMYVWPNRDIYIGEWVDGKRQGLGTLLIKETNSIIQQIWDDCSTETYETFLLPRYPIAQ